MPEQATSKLFFPRGPGPLVTVLLPTRNRPEHLCAALDSFYSLALDKAHVNFVLKIDEDDTATFEVYEKIQKLIPVQALITPRGNGYQDIHLWINEMVDMATGDWLLLFDDNARFTQEGWDTHLLTITFKDESTWHKCPDVCALLCEIVGKPTSQKYIFVRKKTVEILGHWSPIPSPNFWMAFLFGFLGCLFKVPIAVREHTDQITDDVHKEVLINNHKRYKEFSSVDNIQKRLIDVKKLIKYVADFQQSTIR